MGLGGLEGVGGLGALGGLGGWGVWGFGVYLGVLESGFRVLRVPGLGFRL